MKESAGRDKQIKKRALKPAISMSTTLCAY